MAKTNPTGDATTTADSQAQAGADATDKTQTPERRAESSGEPQYFDTTIVKLDKDGNEVLSDNLMPGETLRRSVTDLHYANPAQAKANDEAVREAALADADENRKAAEQR